MRQSLDQSTCNAADNSQAPSTDCFRFHVNMSELYSLFTDEARLGVYLSAVEVQMLNSLWKFSFCLYCRTCCSMKSQIQFGGIMMPVESMWQSRHWHLKQYEVIRNSLASMVINRETTSKCNSFRLSRLSERQTTNKSGLAAAKAADVVAHAQTDCTHCIARTISLYHNVSMMVCLLSESTFVHNSNHPESLTGSVTSMKRSYRRSLLHTAAASILTRRISCFYELFAARGNLGEHAAESLQEWTSSVLDE